MSVSPGEAAMLEALKAKNRRTDEETSAASDGAAAAPPPAGRAVTQDCGGLIENKNTVGDSSASAAEPSAVPPVQPKGRAALLAKLKAQIAAGLTLAPAPSQPATAEDKSEKSPSGSGVCPRPSLPSSPVIRRGEGGKKVSLTANYVRLEVEKGRGVFEYEVRFSPPVDSKNERFKCLNQHRNIIGPTKTFDGVVLYLPFLLTCIVTLIFFCQAVPYVPFFVENKTVLQSKRSNDGSPVTVTISLKCQKRMGDRDCIQLYNTLFNRIMNTLKMCMINRNFYDPRNGRMIPQHKLEIWPGYVTSVNEYEDGVMLCCDVSHRVLHTQTVRDILVDIHKMGKEKFIANAQKALIGSIVLTRYNNRSYRIDDIDFDATPSSTFTDYTGKEMSFVEYYKRQYNIDIKDPKQPMLLHRERKKAYDEQGVTKLICLVPELTFMTGLTDAMRADSRVMKDVDMYTRVTPNQRQLSLKKFIQNVTSSEEASAHLKNWGLKLSPNPIRLEGRVLDRDMISTSFENMMVVEVYHNHSRESSSIPEVFVSMNNTFSRWHSSTCYQMPGQELIDALKIAFIKGLKKYYETNHRYPDTVIIFRDGVIELSVAAKHEAQQFKDCFKDISDVYSPGLGFVVVQKTNTRIFLMQGEDWENPAPGTVLDHTITKRDWYDFFLVSQHVGQDTGSPSRYIVVNDSSSLCPDMMQTLTYKLTQGIVVVPAPCPYAY